MKAAIYIEQAITDENKISKPNWPPTSRFRQTNSNFPILASQQSDCYNHLCLNHSPVAFGLRPRAEESMVGETNL